MFGWFKRKPKPAPIPAGPTIVVRATGLATNARKRPGDMSSEDVMRAAVEGALADGIPTHDPRMAGYVQKARADYRQARRSANATGQAVTLHVGAKTFAIAPD